MEKNLEQSIAFIKNQDNRENYRKTPKFLTFISFRIKLFFGKNFCHFVLFLSALLSYHEIINKNDKRVILQLKSFVLFILGCSSFMPTITKHQNVNTHLIISSLFDLGKGQTSNMYKIDYNLTRYEIYKNFIKT